MLVSSFFYCGKLSNCDCRLTGAVRLFIHCVRTDFCSGGDNSTPDGTLIDIMAVQGYTEADLVYRIARFYISVSGLCYTTS